MSDEETEYDLSAELYNLTHAYSVLVEIDAQLLARSEQVKLNKAKQRILDTIVSYSLALPDVGD